MADRLVVRGAREHNLKNIDLDIPKNKLVVITGLSGSGKSSLAFDTIYAEGQRRYVESLSAYARQFLQLMEKPDVDTIEGLSPAISIEQKATSHNPRSTVGTVTEIHDYLRLLFARAGTPHCPEHDLPLEAQSVSQMVDTVLSMPEETKLMILAPVVSERKGEFVDFFQDLQAQGFVRFRVRSGGGTANAAKAEIFEVDQLPALKKNDKHSIEVVVDRIKVRPDIQQRLAESFETALRLADGKAMIVDMDTGKEMIFSSKFACPVCSYSLQELEPRLFSFNNPMGACPSCDGLGHQSFFDPKRIVAHPDLSLASGAIKGWDRRNQFYFKLLQTLAKHGGFDVEKPFETLSKKQQDLILLGSGDVTIPFEYINERGKNSIREHAFEGIVANFERRYRETDSMTVREELSRYQNVQTCPECNGSRLRKEARFVKVGEKKQSRAIYEISALPLKEAKEYFEALELKGAKREIADKIVKEISARLRFLNDVGLDYLSLERSADTLSGGEAQRIRLASQIGSGLTGVMYVLDEPSIGLHQRDNYRLIETLKNLRDLGNSVIVVEHDEDIMKAADMIIDIGPEAGTHGGNLVAQGTYDEILQSDSLTSQYLNGNLEISVPKKRRPFKNQIEIKGARENNLQNIDVSFPLDVLTVITGVSGSGKSTLVKKILFPAMQKKLDNAGEKAGQFTEMTGSFSHIKHIEYVDQNPIGRSSRSNPVTYIKAYDDIRDLYAKEKLSKVRGYQAKHFSFNVDGGRCESCKGEGTINVEMVFMADVQLHCETCNGKRFKKEVLEVSFEGKNINDILNMTIDDAIAFFAEHKQTKITQKLQPLQDVGLGYVQLGQSSSTLSGGEAQRIKLASFLVKGATKDKALFVFDEPTTGLHFHDIKKLLASFDALIEKGHSVIVIEHNLDLIKCADWIIDLGPEGGENGGQLLGAGTPEDVVKMKKSITASYLKEKL